MILPQAGSLANPNVAFVQRRMRLSLVASGGALW